MKVKPGKIKAEDKQKYIAALDALYSAIAEVNSRDEIKKLLKNLLTESERLMIGRRLLIAQKLLADLSYERIVSDLGVGVDTINRVDRWLQNEQESLKGAVKRMEKVIVNRNRRKDKKYLDPFSWGGIKSRYPVHSLLLNLLSDK